MPLHSNGLWYTLALVAVAHPSVISECGGRAGARARPNAGRRLRVRAVVALLSPRDDGKASYFHLGNIMTNIDEGYGTRRVLWGIAGFISLQLRAWPRHRVRSLGFRDRGISTRSFISAANGMNEPTATRRTRQARRHAGQPRAPATDSRAPASRKNSTSPSASAGPSHRRSQAAAPSSELIEFRRLLAEGHPPRLCADRGTTWFLSSPWHEAFASKSAD